MIKSHLLYQLSYTPMKHGASEGSRTLDNHLGKVALYQLSYARFKNQAGLYQNLPCDATGVFNSVAHFSLYR